MSSSTCKCLGRESDHCIIYYKPGFTSSLMNLLQKAFHWIKFHFEDNFAHSARVKMVQDALYARFWERVIKRSCVLAQLCNFAKSTALVHDKLWVNFYIFLSTDLMQFWERVIKRSCALAYFFNSLKSRSFTTDFQIFSYFRIR